MALFDILRFRSIAFRPGKPPDHPMDSEDAARELLGELPAGDPLSALAEATHWTTSLNRTDGFSPGRRARVLLLLDDAARKVWRELGTFYLAPEGRPAPGLSGDTAVLDALFESAAEFAVGYGLCIDPVDGESEWVSERWAALALRRARWLARRLTLANMLRRAEADAIWEAMHALYFAAESRKRARDLLPVFPGDPFPSSVKQEYIRLLLVDMADLDAMQPREVELAFRIALRLAAAVQLEPGSRSGATVYAVVPSGANRPEPVSRMGRVPDNALYLDTTNALPRLRALLDRDASADPGDQDTLFGWEFTVGERRSVLKRLLAHWGPEPPTRAARRVPVAAIADVHRGLRAVSRVMPLLDQGAWNRSGADGAQGLSIQLDDEELAAQRAGRSVERESGGRVLDASSGGIGIAMRRADARAAELGQLAAVRVRGREDWAVGVVRRVGADREELRLGLQLSTRRPRLVWFRRETVERASPWEQELLVERRFLDFFQSGILLDTDGDAIASGRLIVAPGVAERGNVLAVPLAGGVLKLKVVATEEAGPDWRRIRFETSPMVPYAERKSAPARGGFEGWRSE